MKIEQALYLLVVALVVTAGVSCGGTRSQQEQTPVVNLQSDSLIVTLHDNWSAAVPAAGKGHVKLFSGTNLIQEADTDSSQSVQFLNLQPGTFRYEVYSRDNALGYSEYWGQASRTIASGEKASVVFQRTQPFVDSVAGIYGLPYAYGERWPLDNRGEQLNATVLAGTPTNGETGLISVQILFDRDQALPADLTLDCGTPVAGTVGGDSTFTCGFYPFFSVLPIGATYSYSVVVYQDGNVTYVQPWQSAFALANQVCGTPPHLCS